MWTQRNVGTTQKTIPRKKKKNRPPKKLLKMRKDWGLPFENGVVEYGKNKCQKFGRRERKTESAKERSKKDYQKTKRGIKNVKRLSPRKVSGAK